ncbi:MAG: glucodextranase DOMON-like domain-containing protein, partial [bacterium]|nr:glucodextranase DOMON-like domain-containing protein [bacterium]
LDAIPQPGESLPKISGTVSQAWSLAEFIRNVYQDMLGILVNSPDKKIVFSPELPEKISQIKFKIPLPESAIFIHLIKNSDQLNEIMFHYVHGRVDYNFEVKYPSPISGKKISFQVTLQPKTIRRIGVDFIDQPRVLLDDQKIDWQWDELAISTEKLPRLQFADPVLAENLKCFQPPPFPLLSGEQISRKNSDAKQLFDVADTAFDDRGLTGNYAYPQNAQFEDGIFDLTRFQLFEDDTGYFFRLKFRNLVQPGWHPEYGFQLTFVAIAINQPWQKGGGNLVPRNANYQLPADFQYHRLLLIGGSMQIEDDRGEVVAAYRPSDVRFPLGNIGTKTIEFA